MTQEQELREKIAEFCHDTDFTCGMAEEPFVAESWDLAPDGVKESYRKEADQILSLIEVRVRRLKKVCPVCRDRCLSYGQEVRPLIDCPACNGEGSVER